jgi:hypothetical protein
VEPTAFSTLATSRPELMPEVSNEMILKLVSTQNRTTTVFVLP